MEKSPVMCHLMPLIMKYIDKRSFLDLPLVSKDFNEAVQGCSDVFWEKLEIVQYLTWGKITPSGIPCSVKRLDWPINIIYTFTYIPLTHGTSPGQIFKSYVEFIKPAMHFDISVTILTREEHFLIRDWETIPGQMCLKFQCIYSTRSWHSFNGRRSGMPIEAFRIIRRVDGLDNLLLDYSGQYPVVSDNNTPVIVFLERKKTIEMELNDLYDTMNG